MDILRDGEIVLSGTVGSVFFEDGFTYLDVVEALASIGRNNDVTVHINSGGGIATEGIAIYNAFDSHKGNVTMIIESIAASAASVIAMAGDSIIMRSGASMMVHDPAGFTMGNSQEHAKSMEMLETMATSMADIYSEKTGRPAAEIREEMKVETWMTAKEAVAKGYADKIDKARSKEPTAFDYRLYQHAPERMVALAQSRGWKHPGATADSAAKPPSTNGENTMTDAEKAAAEKAAAEKIVADKAAAEKLAAEKAAAETAAVGDAVANAVKAERQRAADIHAACQMVGKADKATAFISEGKTLSEVVAALQSERAANPNTDVNTRHVAAAKPGTLDKQVDRVNARFTNGRAAS
jgi:ATP-dependent protease ClpP protease subunit